MQAPPLVQTNMIKDETSKDEQHPWLMHPLSSAYLPKDGNEQPSCTATNNTHVLQAGEVSECAIGNAGDVVVVQVPGHSSTSATAHLAVAWQHTAVAGW